MCIKWKIFEIPANQFTRSKDGDRFFFTHKNQKGSFTKSARETLKSRTLAGIICDNTGITAVPSNVFMVTEKSNFINCNDTPKLGDIQALLEIGTDWSKDPTKIFNWISNYWLSEKYCKPGKISRIWSHLIWLLSFCQPLSKFRHISKFLC